MFYLQHSMNFQHYVNLICRPNPQVIKDDAEREIAFNRNKSVLFIEIFSFVSMAVYILVTNRLPTPVQNVSFLTIVFILSFFLLTCRSYPNVFRVFYFTVVTVFGPLAQYYNKDSIFFNCVGVSILPTWMLYLSGSKLLFFLQLLIQAGYMHGLYKPLLIETLHNMTPEAYVHRLANITTFGIFVNCTFLLTTHMALLKAYTKISVTRSKKEDLERQKIFLLGFSHELRNLINSMIGNIQLCTLEVVNEKVRGLLQNSQVCGELLMHLVTNILDTGKAEIGDLEINPTPNYIHETLEKLWNVCSQLIKNKRLAGVMRIQEKIPELLEFDNYRVTQILMNLVGNSVKYTDQGIIQVSIDWLEGQEEVRDSCFEPKPFDDDDEGVFEKSQTLATLLRNDLITLDLDKKKRIPRSLEATPENLNCKQGILKIIVSDSGPGISEEKLGVLFKKFPQISGELSKKRLGTGLGLYVTKELIEKMKGEVRVYSKEGVGTVFIACIPVKVVSGHVPVNIGMDAFLSVLGSLNLRTMIVDDMDFNVIVIKNYLSKLGLKVTDVARNGKEAVDKYMESYKNRQMFDIITMDIEMPVMDGKEAIRRIRAFEKQNGLVSSLIIVISGNCSESEIGECLDAKGIDGANVFLKKPVGIEDLSRIIKLAFEKRVWTLSRGKDEIVKKQQ